MPFGPIDLVELADDALDGLTKIPGFPGYYITPAGDVFSIRKLKPQRDPQGYWRISSRRLRKGVHWLLAKTFLAKPRADQVEVRHLDGNPANNVLDNLAWGTRGENAADMAEHGTVKGEGNPRAVLTRTQVLEIRSLAASGTPQSSLARSYGVSTATVHAVVARINWKHVREETADATTPRN